VYVIIRSQACWKIKPQQDVVTVPSPFTV